MQRESTWEGSSRQNAQDRNSASSDKSGHSMHPTAAAAQAAAGAASSAAMAGVMLALKALRTDSDSLRRSFDELQHGDSGVQRVSSEFEKNGLSVPKGLLDRETEDSGIRRTYEDLQNGAGKDERRSSNEGKSSEALISRNITGRGEGASKKHRKKRNGAGMGVRLDVPMDGLAPLQGVAAGTIQSSSKVLRGEGINKRGGGAHLNGKEVESTEKGGETQRKGGAKPAAGKEQSPAADTSEPSVLLRPQEPASCEAREVVQIEDPPEVGDGYLGSSGSVVEGLGERSASESSLEEKEKGGKHLSGKKHSDEDETSESWRKHKRHFFILSNAGKPIYSRYGDEHRLAGFSATLQAIMSYVESSGDSIQSIRAGSHKIVFVARGPIYLVAISATGEPELSLRRKLDLLYGQLISILTDSIERTFRRNTKFDVHPLLGGTELVFASLVHAFSWDFSVLLQAFTCLPLPYAARQAAGVALQEIASPGLVFGFLLAPGGKVISVVSPKRTPPNVDDLLLLCNFVGSSESFKSSENFVPFCMPNFDASAFLYAYVSYLEPDVCLVLLTSQQDGFFHLKECRAHIEQSLRITGVFREVSASLTRGSLRVEEVPTASMSAQRQLGAGQEAEGTIASLPASRSSITASNHTLRQKQTASGDASTSGRWGFGTPTSDGGLAQGLGGPAGLWHFLYRNTQLDQYVASEYSAPLDTRPAQKGVFQAYQRLLASMHGDGGKAGPHRMQYRRDSKFVMLAWSTADFDFYAVFDPLAEKEEAIAVCNRVCSGIREIEGDLFQRGPVPLAW